MDPTLLAILTGATAAAVINGIFKLIENWQQHRQKKEDKGEEDIDGRLKAIEKSLAAITDGTKYLLYDRIRYLGTKYIQAGEVDFDDRRILNGMHNSYHAGLGGNGDLDSLMQTVNALPLRISKGGQT